MGQFSWFTQDTNHRIVNGEEYKVIMTDNNGHKYVEYCYEGYGVFGGKDYYELLAEMNGLGSDRYAGISSIWKDYADVKGYHGTGCLPYTGIHSLYRC